MTTPSRGASVSAARSTLKNGAAGRFPESATGPDTMAVASRVARPSDCKANSSLSCVVSLGNHSANRLGRNSAVGKNRVKLKSFEPPARRGYP